ncbi:uncharacterized protein LOC135396126 isoform X2 [Ornithodoros turicata]|uniref:uncharacterized protein LOC135396126 isoform X2 n=1 Tax=Ornithodoros turicata TaxID=34597 RepID=UPI003139C7D5
MAVLKRCCCRTTLRHGSYASGIFTLCFYSFHLCTCIAQFSYLDDILGDGSITYVFVLLLMLFSALSVLSSVMMLIGLCTSVRFLLLPWVVCVSFTTLLDILLSFCILADEVNDVGTIIFFVADYLICALNIYCLLCVISQYQESRKRRRRTHTVAAVQDTLAMRYEGGCKTIGSSFPDKTSGPPKPALLLVPDSRTAIIHRASIELTSISDVPCSYQRSSTDESNSGIKISLPTAVDMVRTPP